MQIAATSVLACVAGAEMGRRLGGREKGGGLESEDKVINLPFPFPFCAFLTLFLPLPLAFLRLLLRLRAFAIGDFLFNVL